jgi:NAD(P)-dependent dehydrogenase (short-subunit alcohol dehydrogenase family)
MPVPSLGYSGAPLTVHADDAATDFSIADRVIIVTGASSGIGRAIASELARAGGRVAAVARRADRLEALAAEVPGVTPFACDLYDPASREQLVGQVRERLGQIDGLVNNAGLTGRGVPANRESLDEIQAMLDINVKAPLDLAVRCLPAMREVGKGAIVNITTVATLITMGTYIPQVGYCTSKSGLAHMTRELATQWARHNVRVNAIAPGWIASEMTVNTDLTEIGVPDWIDVRLALRRPGLGVDIARATQFLLSDASCFITGQEIAVDGGYSIT